MLHSPGSRAAGELCFGKIGGEGLELGAKQIALHLPVGGVLGVEELGECTSLDGGNQCGVA
jgi:hypothetical protein